MQEIKAYIKHRKLEAVTLALHRVQGVTGMSVAHVVGFGRSKVNTSAANPIEGAGDFVKHVKVEIVCHDQYVDEQFESRTVPRTVRLSEKRTRPFQAGGFHFSFRPLYT